MLAKRRYRTALAWQVALATYMQLISWVPLGRWNYQPCCPTGLELLRRDALSIGDAAGVSLFLLPAALFWLGGRRQWAWALWLALLATTVWLALQLITWWPRYLFGASERWSQVYERAFAQSTQLLPRWGDHLPPDAAHLVLQVLLVGAVVSAVRAIRRRRSSVNGAGVG